MLNYSVVFKMDNLKQCKKTMYLSPKYSRIPENMSSEFLSVFLRHTQLQTVCIHAKLNCWVDHMVFLITSKRFTTVRSSKYLNLSYLGWTVIKEEKKNVVELNYKDLIILIIRSLK